ncbi:glycoside hydrolase [Mycobacterium adipatum]|jgi:cell wall-associated NlpC family hydrolase|uniref:Glycoside hydrolase n=1 Tax=Mycobacterium adipatum TaxID=1682113 RepID=A0A172URP6_9MYCO|nr:C40 family peptidase [Mycobacterium adipatum]ANE81859.1 glycoside hydrolase [Mycobacterium adipatum]MBI5736397.1 C40 family peptidase [Mycolicibacterium neoaurum]
MPGALTATLSAPLHQLLALVGSGPPGPPAAALAGWAQQLDAAAAAIAGTGEQMLTSWNGSAAASAADRLGRAVATARLLGDRVAALGAEVAAATEAVARVRAALQRLIADFEARAAALETALERPGAAEQLVDEAREALARALRMLEELRSELDAGAHNLTGAAPAGVAPAGSGGSVPGSAPGFGTGSGPVGGTGSGPVGGTGSGPAPAPVTEAAFTALRDDVPDAAQFGAGVAVTLPDGSTVTAPNAVAAGAVRHALTQLGVPYQWGGTTAGVGLDCSGLTQWAYHQAGLDIPRLAQEQDIGAAVDSDSLRPGDLAVWDGHVAMVVGNGVMVEAGDPVQLSAIRTTNAGQGFQGFWRPTA